MEILKEKGLKMLDYRASLDEVKEQLSFEDISGYQNKRQEDQRNFLALRVFPPKFKDMMTNNGLEEEAQDGNRLL